MAVRISIRAFHEGEEILDFKFLKCVVAKWYDMTFLLVISGIATPG